MVTNPNRDFKPIQKNPSLSGWPSPTYHIRVGGGGKSLLPYFNTILLWKPAVWSTAIWLSTARWIQEGAPKVSWSVSRITRIYGGYMCSFICYYRPSLQFITDKSVPFSCRSCWCWHVLVCAWFGGLCTSNDPQWVWSIWTAPWQSHNQGDLPLASPFWSMSAFFSIYSWCLFFPEISCIPRLAV